MRGSFDDSAHLVGTADQELSDERKLQVLVRYLETVDDGTSYALGSRLEVLARQEPRRDRNWDADRLYKVEVERKISDQLSEKLMTTLDKLPQSYGARREKQSRLTSEMTAKFLV